jgi:hypothetical protein
VVHVNALYNILSYNKALKAFFSVKSKKKTCLKLFDSLLKPILTYGSEIWLSDYNINLNNFDHLVIFYQIISKNAIICQIFDIKFKYFKYFI